MEGEEAGGRNMAMALVKSSQEHKQQDEEEPELTPEDHILLRVTANHLFLGQFEPFRANLKTLSGKNPHAAAAMLRAVVRVGGRLPGVLFSDSVPSAAHLAWMCFLELEEFEERVHCIGNIRLVREVVEVLLLFQQVEIDYQEAGGDNEAESSGRVLEPGFTGDVAELYLNRLKVQMKSQEEGSFSLDTDKLEKNKSWVEYAAISQPSIMNAICRNIRRQQELDTGYQDDFGNILQQQVQGAHLKRIEEYALEGKLEKSIYHLQYLDESSGIPESEFSKVVSLLAEKCINNEESRKLFKLAYEGLFASGSTRLLSVLEASQDKAVESEDIIEVPISMPRPFWKLHEQLEALRAKNIPPNDIDIRAEDILHIFMRDVFHYARVKREHVLEIAMKIGLAAVKALELQIAADVVYPFPRLQPLLAAMGWDLLSGNTTARQKLMKLLWFNKSKLSIELPPPSTEFEEVSFIEDLCERLCYNLEVAYFIADVKSGQKKEYMGPRIFSESLPPSDNFAANLVLERLSGESPLRVIFDMIPDIKLENAMNLVKLQPVSSSSDLIHRYLDLELLHMHFGYQVAAAAIISIASEDKMSLSLTLLKELQQHFEAIKTPVRKIWLLGIITAFLQVEESALKCELPEEFLQENGEEAINEEQPVMIFIRWILEMIHHHLSPPGFDLQGRSEPGWREAWENERIRISRFVEDWRWRVLVLERIILRPNKQLSFKSAHNVLLCPPSTLLNICIQKSQYDLAKEAVTRFGLSRENAALVQLTEYLDENISKGKTNFEEDLKSLIAAQPSAPVSTAVLCLDVAATYAPSMETAKVLLEQARDLLSQSSQEKNAHQFVSVPKRVLQKLFELVEQGHSTSLSTLLSGFDTESSRRQRALTTLHQIIEDAHNGKGQFLSGKLHNLMKALADEEFDDSTINEKKQSFVGLGLRPLPNASASSSTPSEEAVQKPTAAKRFLVPLANKPTAYLSAFILYIATIGDIIDGVDTTHDFNFFSLLYERPGDLLTQLVFKRGSTEGASKVAEIMGLDLVHQVISACVPPVHPPRQSRNITYKDMTNICTNDSRNVPLQPNGGDYELNLETVKYLSTLSPVRSILACVFGNKDSSIGNDFAVEQAERYPTLQRWIQVQANLQRLCDSNIFSTKVSTIEESKNIPERAHPKRRREVLEDEEDAEENTDIPESPASEYPPGISSVQFFEDEYPYQEAVDRLIKDGKLVDALAFADRWLRAGAPDKLLQLLIERGEDSVPSSSHWQGLTGSTIWNNSWQYCIRLQDKRLAATLALKYLHRWELDAAIDVLTMCSCHLPTDDVLLEEVIRVKKHLQQYRQILREDPHFRNWQEVESFCERDPEGLALRLAGKGAVTAALDIAESFKLSDDLRRELQGRQLVKLLSVDPINGGGPAEALRFLGSLNRPEDTLAVVMAAMDQLPNLHYKQLLVHYLLKRQIGLLSEEEHARMDRLALGLKMLGSLPLPWQQRCAGLHEQPQLILETLLMWKQFQAASHLLEAFPLLRNDKLIITYASKAISVPPISSERQIKVSGNKLGISNGTSRDATRRPYSWGTRDTRNKIAPKDTRKRKSTLPPSQKAAWEAMAGYQEQDRPIGLGPESYEKLASLTMADEWVLTGDPVKDESVRSSHKYESAPSFVLFKALLSLCSDQAGAAKSAVELAVSQVKSILSAEYLPVNASSEAVERSYHAAGTFVQVLLDARTQLHKLIGNKESSSHITTNEEVTDTSSSSLTKLLSEADVWLNRIELLHFLLGSGVTALVEDVADEKSALLLRDRLIREERYGMAVYTCTKCKIDVFPVWEAWGYALLRIEHYAQARLKFKKALQLYKEDPVKVVQKIVDTMESCPPADVHAARSLYVHMAKSVSSASDDSLSADSYLNVLYIPTFTRAERWKKSGEESKETFAYPDEIALPLSNLDTTRYEECKYYLEEYAPGVLLPFMFRHGHYTEGCLLFFPIGAVPVAPAVLSSGSSKLDSLATEYGTIDELCDSCVVYGAVTNLERVLEARISSSVGSEDAQVAQHTSAALTRICYYFETHRHFNHLYRFQVLKKDYIAAGLCCIQLFLNSSTQEQALRHLERAKGHFEEGLLARHQAIENVKVAAKARGKSPSEKLTDEDLIKFSARVTIQMEVVRCFSDAEGYPWKRSLFGNPSDNDTFKRRCEVAEALVEKNFDLAFQIIYDFGLPAVYIYAGVAAALAEKRKYNNLAELLRNIKGTIDNEDLDQIIGAAISVYANKHRERPDRLIDMLSSSHRKVLACVTCGRLKSAFQIASRSNNVADVEWVAQQARMTGALAVEDMCKQWLARSSGQM